MCKAYFCTLFLAPFWILFFEDKKIIVILLLSLFQIWSLLGALKFTKSLLARIKDRPFIVKLNEVPFYLGESAQYSFAIPKKFQNVKYCTTSVKCIQDRGSQKKAIDLWKNHKNIESVKSGTVNISLPIKGGLASNALNGIKWMILINSDLFQKEFEIPVFEKTKTPT